MSLLQTTERLKRFLKRESQAELRDLIIERDLALTSLDTVPSYQYFSLATSVVRILTKQDELVKRINALSA